MSASNYLENKILEHVLKNTAYTSPTTVYLALYTSNPTDADTGTEVTGGSYARQTITFAAASGGTIVSNNAQTFTDLPAATITHWGLSDALSGGNLLIHDALTSAKTTSANDDLTFASGYITVNLD